MAGIRTQIRYSSTLLENEREETCALGGGFMIQGHESGKGTFPGGKIPLSKEIT